MLTEFDWTIRVAAAALAAGLVTLFVTRALNKDRREFRSFRRLRSTVKRQLVMRRWLIESMVVFGGAAVLVLLVVWPVIIPLLTTMQEKALIADVRDMLGSGLWVGIAVLVIFGIATVVGLRSVRRDGGVVMVGDIGPMLPRNRPELGLGAALSLNAGIVEEALFRVAMPALLVIVTGEPISAFVLSSVIFGGLHAYQGVVGMLTTFAVGLLLSAVYILSGSVVLIMVIHALFDLRTLVLIPMAVYGVHRIPGTIKMPPPIIMARISVTLWKPKTISRIVASVPTVMPQPDARQPRPSVPQRDAPPTDATVAPLTGPDAPESGPQAPGAGPDAGPTTGTSVA